MRNKVGMGSGTRQGCLLCAQLLVLSDSFVTPRTTALQASLSRDFPGKKTRVGCHFLLQRIFLTQELNPCVSYIAGRLFSAEPLEKPYVCSHLLSHIVPVFLRSAVRLGKERKVIEVGKGKIKLSLQTPWFVYMEKSLRIYKNRPLEIISLVIT